MMTLCLGRGTFIAVIFLIVASANGCAKINQAGIHPGQTSQAEVEQNLGPGQVSNLTTSSGPARILTYPQGNSFQVDVSSGKVVGAYRPPDADERNLQYWLHQWKGLPQNDAPIAGTQDPHGQSERQLVAPTLKTAVIYDSAGNVQRVVSYGTP